MDRPPGGAVFNRILLAIDDSPASEMATAFAGALARQSDGTVHVLHVNEYLVSGRGATLHTRDEARALVTNTVQQLREAGVRAGGSSFVAHYRQVPRRIAETAREHEADAIVLGSRRSRRLGRLFSFQVRERTTRLTALPVLTAPSPLGRIRGDLAGADSVEAELAHVLATPSH
jgi:nucleotide-binding universal stress UspA family protein